MSIPIQPWPKLFLAMFFAAWWPAAALALPLTAKTNQPTVDSSLSEAMEKAAPLACAVTPNQIATESGAASAQPREAPDQPPANHPCTEAPEQGELKLADRNLPTPGDTPRQGTEIPLANGGTVRTRLSGQVIFNVSDVLAGDGNTIQVPINPNSPFANGGSTLAINNPNQNTVLGNRVRIELDTTFTGNDNLKIRLVSGNSAHPDRRAPDGITGFRYGVEPSAVYPFGFPEDPTVPFSSYPRSVEGQQTFQDLGRISPNNSVGIGKISYEFPIGSRARAVVMATGGEHHDYVPTTFNPWDDDNGGTGSLSILGQRNPIYSIMGPGAGVGLDYQIDDRVNISAGFLAGEASNPANGQGLFNGRNSIQTQLTYRPTDRFAVGAIYNRSYLPGGRIFNNDLGTRLGNDPVAEGGDYETSSYGLSALWKVNSGFNISGWLGYTDVNKLPGDFTGAANGNVLTYGVNLAFPNLGKPGNLGGLVIGAAPYATSAQVPTALVPFYGTSNLLERIPNAATPFHIEGFYVHQLSNNVLLTPGFIWLTAPNQSAINPGVLIGSLRLTLLF